MAPLYHWNDSNRSSERLIFNARLMNVFEQRFLIITFISEMIQIHRDLKWIKIHLLTTKSSNNYEMFNMHKVSSVQKRTEKKSICSGCERWRKITLSYSTTTANNKYAGTISMQERILSLCFNNRWRRWLDCYVWCQWFSSTYNYTYTYTPTGLNSQHI